MAEKEYIERESAIAEVTMMAEDRRIPVDSYCGEVVGEVIRLLREIPAADVLPVVRGRWVGNKRHQSCSECHMTYCVPDGQDGELDMTAYHFCPNCGANMEG